MLVFSTRSIATSDASSYHFYPRLPSPKAMKGLLMSKQDSMLTSLAITENSIYITVGNTCRCRNNNFFLSPGNAVWVERLCRATGVMLGLNEDRCSCLKGCTDEQLQTFDCIKGGMREFFPSGADRLIRHPLPSRLSRSLHSEQ